MQVPRPPKANEESRQTRRKVDFSGLTLNSMTCAAVYVKSSLERTSAEPAFSHLLRKLGEQPHPGFFFTPTEKGDIELKVRLRLNRHGIFSSDIFRDSNGGVYRDVDAKGIGFLGAYPMRVLPIQESHMSGDMELRGICHHDAAQDDWLITDELESYGFRVAKNVAMIELFELVDKTGSGECEIVQRRQVGERLWANMEVIKPVIHVRAMGTTSRIEDLPIFRPEDSTYMAYAKEVIDDAIYLLSLELNQKLSPKDYAVWFIDTLSTMLGRMHSRDINPDFRKQIHGGLHNVTLDCRLLDVHVYDTPLSEKRRAEEMARTVRERPDLTEMLGYGKTHTKEEVIANNLKVERVDIEHTRYILDSFVRGVGEIYDLGGIKNEIEHRFGKAYGKTYIPIRQRHG